MKEKKNKKGL